MGTDVCTHGIDDNAGSYTWGLDGDVVTVGGWLP